MVQSVSKTYQAQTSTNGSLACLSILLEIAYFRPNFDVLGLIEVKFENTYSDPSNGTPLRDSSSFSHCASKSIKGSDLYACRRKNMQKVNVTNKALYFTCLPGNSSGMDSQQIWRVRSIRGPN